MTTIRRTLTTSAETIYMAGPKGAFLSVVLRNATAAGVAARVNVVSADKSSFPVWPGGTVQGYGGASGGAVLMPGDTLEAAADSIQSVHLEVTEAGGPVGWTTFESPNAQVRTAYGEIHFASYAAPYAVVIAAAADFDAETGFVALSPATALASHALNMSMPSNGVLQYDGPGELIFAIHGNVSVSPDVGGDELAVGVSVNGVIHMKATNNHANAADIQTFPVCALHPMVAGDQITLVAGNLDDTDDCSLIAYHLMATGFRSI